MTVYATIIGVLTTLKATPGLPAATLAEIEGYITAAQNGTAAYIEAESGFNPALYSPCLLYTSKDAQEKRTMACGVNCKPQRVA